MHVVMETAQGFRIAWRGIAFLGHHRTLWQWAILPTIINMVVFTLAFALFVFFYQDIYGLATGFVPQTPRRPGMPGSGSPPCASWALI